MNRKLQKLAVFGLLVVVLVGVFNIENAFAHDGDHQWVVDTKKDATCTLDGKIYYKCSIQGCSATKEETIDALGHDYNSPWTITTAPKCYALGKEEQRCSRCQTLLDGPRDVAMVPHKYSWVITTQPDCDITGLEEHRCSECGDVRDTRVVPKRKHNLKWTTTQEPTCVDKGKRTAICLHPGCSYTVNSGAETEIAALGTNQPSGHNYGPWSDPTAGDCENEKTRTRTCEDCGYKQTEKLGFGKHIVRTTTKNGKTYEWFLREPASMNGPGRAVQTCKVCGKVIKSREIKFEGGRYNIAVTAFGPRASAINSALFGLNDRLIPVDFTKIEEQVFALVTDDGILVGEMRVSVMDDTVSVSYQMNDSQTIVSQAVFYMFPDAQSITAADLSDPTRAMPFGTTLPLNGQTYGVIAARLVVNYNAENSANRAFPDSGIYLDGATNNATILQEMTTNLME